MENFIVSALKYRPSTFQSVVGQKSITTTLKNAIRSKQLAHAYLFHGPRGVGKTTCARIFAKTINCFSITPDFEACNECESCKAFNHSRSYNIHELDAASNNTVDDIRGLTEIVRIPPQIGKYSIFIIDEIHMLSQQAFNAFLKTLEEPPAHAIFILATTEKHKIIPTILSRCQIFNFNRIKTSDIVEHLEFVARNENVKTDRDGLNVIAQKSDGAMRDALSIFDQIVSYAGNNITYQDVIDNLNVLGFEEFFNITNSILEGNYSQALIQYNEILGKGFDDLNFLNGLSKHFRDLLVCKDKITIDLLEVGANIRQNYLQQATKCSPVFLFDALEILNYFEINYKQSNNSRLHVELALLKLCSTEFKKHQHANQPVVKAESTSIHSKTVENKSVQHETKPVEQKSAIPSIKDALHSNLKETEKKNDLQNLNIANEKQEVYQSAQNKPLTLGNVKETWNKFLAGVTITEPEIKNLFASSQFEVAENNSIQIKISDNNLLEKCNSYFAVIKSYFEQEFSIQNLTLRFIVAEHRKSEKRFFTSTEKFNFLAEKNPALKLLKDELSLEFE